MKRVSPGTFVGSGDTPGLNDLTKSAQCSFVNCRLDYNCFFFFFLANGSSTLSRESTLTRFSIGINSIILLVVGRANFLDIISIC